jgi:DNA polymerase sigma
MSHLKGNIDQSSKGKLYQTKTVSDKNIPSTKNDLTHVLHLNDYIKQSKVEDLFNYIQKEKPSQFEIKIAINELLKKYEPKNEIFYNMLDIFLKTGWPINFGINIPQTEAQKIYNFELNENEEITLLNLAILLNDIEFVKLVLKYHDQQSINQLDKKGYNAIVYSVLYNKNDNTDVIKLLIANGANVNQNFKIEISPNKYEDHSIFTIACYKNLPNIIKVLVDNPQTYVNFTINPSGDTGLHICARGGMENALKELLSCDRINPEILNKDSKKALELISDNEEKNEMMKLFVNFYNNKSMKKNDVNNTTNNLSMMNNNQYSNMNTTTMNKKIVGNDQINLNNINNINYENINLNNTNKNDEFKNYINNNINIKNKMSNMNNNLEANQLRQNLNMESMISNESSELSEEQENKEKINSNKNVKQQKINMNININTPNQIEQQTNPVKLLNQNIYNNLISNANNPNVNFNVEIPIKMMNKKKGQIKSDKTRALNNFFAPKLNAIPTLNLDINDKTFQLELEINELSSQIKEIDNEKSKINPQILLTRKEIENKQKDLNESKERLENCINELAKCEEQEKELIKKQNEIVTNPILAGKVYKNHDENINKRDLKFRPNEMEDTEMFKILNKDLLDYQQYITEIMRRQNNILQIENRINEIKNIVRSLSQEYEVHEYGSYAFGLNMEWSDIDLVLVKVEQENENNDENILLMQPNNDVQNDNISVANTDSTRESVNMRLLNQNNNNLFMNQINNSNILEYLAHKLSQVNWVLTTKFRENLEVKILKAECCVTIQGEKKRFDIDISLENEKHNGLKCVNLINSYLKEYSVLKPITIALRAILHSANLHLPDKGGLSAYGLILMVVSFIQSQKENFLKNEPDLCGKIFYGFLKHYGILFDFNKYLILTYPANESNSANNDKDSYINMNQYGQEFIILDPLNNTNNVANKSFQFMNLKMAFMIAYMVTKEDCDCGCHFGEAEFENSFQSTEHCYLKRMLNSVRRFQG